MPHDLVLAFLERLLHAQAAVDAAGVDVCKLVLRVTGPQWREPGGGFKRLLRIQIGCPQGRQLAESAVSHAVFAHFKQH